MLFLSVKRLFFRPAHSHGIISVYVCLYIISITLYDLPYSMSLLFRNRNIDHSEHL